MGVIGAEVIKDRQRGAALRRATVPCWRGGLLRFHSGLRSWIQLVGRRRSAESGFGHPDVADVCRRSDGIISLHSRYERAAPQSGKAVDGDSWAEKFRRRH